ncbi:MAG: ABC transporter ATP-binding protein [Pseudomonadota bacterium]
MKNSWVSDFQRIIRLLRLSNQRLLIIGILVALVEIFSGIGALFAIRIVVNVLVDGADVDAGFELSEALWYVLLIGLTLLLSSSSQLVSGLLRTAQGMHVGEYLDAEIHKKAVEIDLPYFESPAYFDSLERARQSGTQRPVQVVNGALLIAKNFTFLTVALLMIGIIEWRVIPAIIFATSLVLLARMKFTRRLFLWRQRRVQLERKASYYDWLITSDQHAKELRVNRLGSYLQKFYGEIRRKVNLEHLDIEKQRTKVEVGVAFIGALMFFGAVLFFVFGVNKGIHTVGDLVFFVLLFRRAEASGRELVSSFSKLYDDRLYLRQIFDFLSIRPKIKSAAKTASIPQSDNLKIRFENVTFSYPNSLVETLKDVNLEIEQGQVVALVGENGSGKSSLIKLLTRLYDPSSGRITLNGIDVREYDVQEYRGLFSVIFQDFGKYAETAHENIRFGDVSAPKDYDGIEDAGKLAGADEFLKRLPFGYETVLSKAFDNGQDISMGQWQRVALARAFYPDSSFLVLDEPTSSLDAKAEIELFRDFREKIGNRGALVVSHQLSTVRLADKIFVLDQGQIAEKGTHEDLLNSRRKYSDLFREQSERYAL